MMEASDQIRVLTSIIPSVVNVHRLLLPRLPTTRMPLTIITPLYNVRQHCPTLLAVLITLARVPGVLFLKLCLM